MKKCLVTGCSGFIGSHLADFLIDKGLAVVGTTFEDSSTVDHIRGKTTLVDCDFRDKDNVTEVVRQANPDYVFHLAAQSLVLPSWEDAENTFKANIFGTLHLLEAIKNRGINPAIVVACSSAEYGLTSKDEIPIKESKEFRPVSPYGVSKVAAHWYAVNYREAYGLFICNGILFSYSMPPRILPEA